MSPEMVYEQVVYQNPFLALKVWQIDAPALSKQEYGKHDKHARAPHNYLWNYHEEIEFLLVLKGSMTAYFAEEQLEMRKGDIALFGSSEPHVTLQSGDSPLSYLVLQIDLRKYWDHSTMSTMMHFSEIIRPLSALNYVFRDSGGPRAVIASHIRDIYDEMNDKIIGYELAVSSRVKTILMLLLRSDARKALHYHDHPLFERLQPAIQYVEERLNEKLSVEEISGIVNMSYTYFVKTFKKAFGMTFTDFVVLRRIKKAEQLLLTSDLSIAEAAANVGISNLGHFYQLFRRLNDCSPKQFRDRLQIPNF